MFRVTARLCSSPAVSSRCWRTLSASATAASATQIRSVSRDFATLSAIYAFRPRPKRTHAICSPTQLLRRRRTHAFRCATASHAAAGGSATATTVPQTPTKKLTWLSLRKATARRCLLLSLKAASPNPRLRDVTLSRAASIPSASQAAADATSVSTLGPHSSMRSWCSAYL